MAKNLQRVKIFSALEVANICGVVNQTAINWIKNGFLKAFVTPGGQYRVYAKDLFAFLDERGMGASEEALQVLMDSANWNTLLLIEGDRELCGFVRTYLMEHFPDFSILEAHDAFNAGRYLTSGKPGYILLGENIPGIEPLSLARTIREDPAFGKPFIIFFCSGDDQGSYEQVSDGVLAKPLDLDRLISVISDLNGQIESSATA
ncbi:MAG: helix-turn-helix domain-containing protein [Treponema sp.]|nr:helix-turn-helix domain-containing protein [Treponema sp.]